MKIGIVTIYDVVNAGALLQCYALCEYVRNMGHDTILFHIPLNKRTLLRRLKRRLFDPNVVNFQRQRLPLQTDNLYEPVDTYLVGSDQVWNPDITLENWQRYMLNFAEDKKPKYSYAASFGIGNWSYSHTLLTAKSLLNRFNSISVREKTGINLLKNTFGIKSCCVLDPCFLLEDYDSRFGLVHKKHRKTQISTYKLCRDEKWETFIKELVKETTAEYHDMNGKLINSLPSFHGINHRPLNIRNWLQSIYDTDQMITDSFHGTVFSIIFKRNFVVLPGVNGRSSRVTDLLDSIGLSDRYVTDYSYVRKVLGRQINYNEVIPKLYSLRDKSISFLESLVTI